MKRNFKWMLVAILTICGAMSVYAQDGYTLERLSNPTFGEGQLDGFIPGGVHGNDYTQSMAIRGDMVYIATARNLGYAFINRYTPKFDFWGIVEDLYNGRLPLDDTNDGARIISYNTKNGNFETIYSGENAIGYRSAVTYDNKVYFGTFSADPTVNPYILMLDKNGNFSKVFETRDCVSLRANCIYENRLYFAGADERETIASTDIKNGRKPAKLAVLRKGGSDDMKWELVANFKSFGDVAYDEIWDTWNDAPIWSLATHNGYIYATIPSSAGFVIFRGHPAATGETSNAPSGWYWEEVAGNNSVNNPGLSDIVGGEPGCINNLSGSLYEFNGQLYAYNFDHSIMGELSVFVNGVKSLTTAEPCSSALDYLRFAYSLLKNPQKVWRLNDVTGKFELQQNFTKHMLSTLNGRLAEYDGQLYVATIDPGHLYSWISQIATDNFIEMTPSEIIAKITALAQDIQILKKRKAQDQQTQTLIEQLELLKALLSSFLTGGTTTTTTTTCPIANIANILALLNLTNTVSGITNSLDYQGMISQIINLIQERLNGGTGSTSGIVINIPNVTTTDYKSLLDAIVQIILGRTTDTTGTELPDLTSVDYRSILDAIIQLIQERFGDEAGNINLPDVGSVDYQSLIDAIVKLIQDQLGDDSITINIPDLGLLLDYQSLLSALDQLLQDFINGNAGTTGNILEDLIYGAIFGNIWENVQALIAAFNSSALSNYIFIFDRMLTNKMGFDMMRTSDGETFEFITRDGLGDKYNYGCPSFVVGSKGLYIGTSNSFYGGQLWLMTNGTTPGSNWAVEEDDPDAIQAISSAASQSEYYTLDGRRVNGKPTQRGIYIINGKKVSIR